MSLDVTTSSGPDLSHLGFGRVFTEHMVTARWTPTDGWEPLQLEPRRAVELDPASTVLHYGQSIFEGLKAYHQPDGSIAVFRPESNAARFQRSARRLALPELPAAAFVSSIDMLIEVDTAWVPSEGERSLYLRPFMFGSESFLGVRPSQVVSYILIASPVDSYFEGGLHPVSVWLAQNYVRAAPGGTGAAKCAGNYAASLVAQLEAVQQGCEQALFLDATERRWLEELAGMNVFLVAHDGTLITPALTGTILEGITRDSVITLAREGGRKVEERPVSFEEWRLGVDSGQIVEAFACGTAAVITPIGTVKWDAGEFKIGGGETIGPVVTELRQGLLDIQYGRAPDVHGWMHRAG
jgi:branched-chain amino acid aminotransferase